jgi:hypothetical protein
MDDKRVNHHVIAGVIKAWFRELPDAEKIFPLANAIIALEAVGMILICY